MTTHASPADEPTAVRLDARQRPQVEAPTDGVPVGDTGRLVRTPTSALQLVIGLAVLSLGVVVAWRYANTGAATNFDAEDLTRRLPEWLRVLPPVLLDVVLVLAPVVINVVLLARRRWRLWLLVNLGAFAAAVLASELVALLTRVPPSRFPDAYVVEGRTATPNEALFAALVAAFVIGLPYLRRRTRRAGSALIAVYLLATLTFSVLPSTGALVDLGMGIVCGALVGLAFGTPERRPGPAEVAASLARSGIATTEVAPAAVDARGSTPWFATTPAGGRLFVKVLDGENRSADLLFRLVRFVRLRRSGGDRAPFSSLRRAVEHEALLSLRASSVGLPTPELLAVSEIGTDGFLLAYRAIDGASLDGVADEDLTDDVLVGTWRLVAAMRAAGIAHRDLRLANLFLARDPDGGGVEPMLIDFGFAELAAEDLLLDSDVAELLASTTPRVGVGRAVDAAEQVLGAEALAQALPRLQPLLLGTATRTDLKRSGLLEELRHEVEARAGRPDAGVRGLDTTALLAPVRHPGPRAAVFVAVTVAAWAGLVAGVGAEGVGTVLGGVDPWLVGAAVAAALAVRVAAVLSLQGAARDPLPAVATGAAQLAATTANALTPAAAGGIGVEVRFLLRYGLDLPSAVTAAGLQVLSLLAVRVTLLYAALQFAERDGDIDLDLPTAVLVLATVAAAALLAALPLVVPSGRRLLLRRVLPVLRSARAGLRTLGHQPVRAAQLLAGDIGTTVAVAATLALSVRAVGGTVPATTMVVIVCVATVVAACGPTPGGAGLVEAVCVVGLVLAGEDPAVALVAVALFRLLSSWLPVAAGAVVTARLRRAGRL